jgi:hypothetical protein
LARTGQNPGVSPSGTAPRSMKISLRREKHSATYGNEDATSRVEEAAERGAEHEGGAHGEAAPGQATLQAALASGSGPVAASDAGAGSNGLESAAPVDGVMTQVTEHDRPALARTGQNSELTPYPARAQISEICKVPEKLGAAHGNGEATPVLDETHSPAPGASPGQVVREAHVFQASARAGIDKRGLDREEREIVRLLIGRRKPVGLEAIASRLGLDVETLRDVHEPFLERQGLVERTERGRVATEKAWRLYGAVSAARPCGSGARKCAPAFRGIPVLAFPRLGG